MALTIHEHPFASYCWKALIALNELGLPFERVFVGGEEDRAKLAELWPMGGIPVLVDDDAGLTLPEATVIVEHLDSLAGGGRLIPPDPEAALQVRLWDRIFDGYVMTPMQKIVLDSLRPEGANDVFGVAEARADLDRAYAMLNDRLPAGTWAAGDDFTLAECAAAPSLFYARVVHRWDEEKLETLTDYYRRLESRPSVAKVIDEGREYRSLFPLPWPEWVE
jgi:glutathione S-transferase